jgi:carboxylesterase type B
LNTSFSGSKEAIAYPPNCIGLGSDTWGYPISEDCLYVNVVRPHGHDEEKHGLLPIAVWIHGGGFYMGGSGDLRFNLSFIVENGQKEGTPFIAISLNYRLNGFGFLYSNEVRGEGGTNLGLRDQRLALHWVYLALSTTTELSANKRKIQENARLFGGDPRRVTIWGQSCGGNSVGFHMVAYSGRDDGLFSAGVMQSGNPAAWRALNGTEFYQPLYHNVTAHVHPSTEFAAENGLKPTDFCSEAYDTLACLRTGSVAELTAVFNGSRDISQKWFPVVDGDFLKEYPSRQLNRGQFVKVPILSGTATNEGHWFVPPLEDKPEDFYRYLVRKSCQISLSVGPMPEPWTYGPTNADCFLPDPQVFTGRPYQLGLPKKLADKFFELYPPGICPDYANGTCTGPSINANDPRIAGMNPTYLRASTFAGDAIFIAPRRQTCEALTRFGMAAYCYRFDTIPAGQVWPTHFHEAAFVFDNTKGIGYNLPVHPLPFKGKDESYSELAKFISRSWVSFFIHHDPNAWRRKHGVWDGLEPEWPVYNNEDPEDYVFLPTSEGGSYVEKDTWRKEQIKLINDNAHIFQR